MCNCSAKWNTARSLGPLKAFSDCFIEFLIKSNPFSISPISGISIGVRLNQDLWLVKVDIDTGLSAQVLMKWPQFMAKYTLTFAYSVWREIGDGSRNNLLHSAWEDTKSWSLDLGNVQRLMGCFIRFLITGRLAPVQLLTYDVSNEDHDLSGWPAGHTGREVATGHLLPTELRCRI